jgi:hypothetical protein
MEKIWILAMVDDMKSSMIMMLMMIIDMHMDGLMDG